MNSNIEYDQFIEIFAEKVSKLFKCEERFCNGRLYYDYQYIHDVDGVRMTKAIDLDIKDDIMLLERWIHLCHGYSSKYKPKKILDFVYKNISISDLDIYISIINHLSKYIRPEYMFDSVEFIDIFKKTINLTLMEFMGRFQYHIDTSRFKIKIPSFNRNIRIMNNNKISEVWWMWKDYSDEHKNYVEWFPRETLDDLIAIQNGGIVQPDYTTYMEI